MSTSSPFMERLARRARILDGGRVDSGSPVRFRLTFRPNANLPKAAEVMIRRHLPVKMAHETINRLFDNGRTFVSVPCVEDVSIVVAALKAEGVDAVVHPLQPPGVLALRNRMNMTVEGFASRYGLDASLVERWETGAAEPDTAATTLLRTIARHPEAVEESLDMEDDTTELTSA